MTTGFYVLAVLGESPSVLTELLWWARVHEHQPLAGVEVWTTQSGARLLLDLTEGPGWSTLIDQIGPLRDIEADNPKPRSGFGFRLHVFEDPAGEQLTDVRSPAESAVVVATLHDRLRDLRSELDDTIPILGSLAGGRKTASAALQTAFSMQARPGDRLVHVLLDAQLEAWLREHGELQRYLCPSTAWEQRSGVPCSDQVVVYDVHFPRLRYLVNPELSAVLDRRWDSIWPTLEANLGRNTTALLERTFTGWRYTIQDRSSGVLVARVDLTDRLGAILVAMAETPEDATAVDLVEWLDTHDAGWRPTGPKRPARDRVPAIRQARHHLRKKLAGIPKGLERFIPPKTSFDMHGIEVDWELDQPLQRP